MLSVCASCYKFDKLIKIENEIFSEKEGDYYSNINACLQGYYKDVQVLISGFCQYLHATHINCSIDGQFNLIINLICGRKNQPFYQ